MIKDLVYTARSIRRYQEEKGLPASFLTDLVDTARLVSSGGNLQPLKYITAESDEMRAKIFPLLRWAGYLTDWDGPEEGRRPAGYILILTDDTVRKHETAGQDVGIAAQTMMLAAAEQGIGCCMLGSIDRPKLSALFELPPHLYPTLMLTFGYPDEISEVTEASDSIRYYRDDNEKMWVPKRSLSEVLVLSR